MQTFRYPRAAQKAPHRVCDAIRLEQIQLLRLAQSYLLRPQLSVDVDGGKGHSSDTSIVVYRMRRAKLSQLGALDGKARRQLVARPNLIQQIRAIVERLDQEFTPLIRPARAFCRCRRRGRLRRRTPSNEMRTEGQVISPR